MNKQGKCGFAKKIGSVSCLAGGALVLFTLIAFVSTAIYETVVPPTDMHLAGLLTAAMAFYVAPVGVVLLILGGLTRLGVFLLCRKSR
jgi:hypothetical protein